ncbi:MAG: Crp/Fnr family transcriptional regulator [Clostridiaceae bacterium]|nr:Crp/Fnr family transcriptional regulator [Clostridiaceae bacterium]
MEHPERYFPMWEELTAGERETLLDSATYRRVKAGTILHSGKEDCVGLFLIVSGQLRVYIMSQEGREITLYRLFERDICLFSASCIFTAQFDIMITAETDTELWVIPAPVYKKLAEKSAILANFTNTLMADRFSDVMWLFDQILFKSFDKRLAGFLLEESIVEGGGPVRMTHEKLAAHLGSAREVVTRMLRYFQNVGLVRLSRGEIELTDKKSLETLAR